MGSRKLRRRNIALDSERCSLALATAILFSSGIVLAREPSASGAAATSGSTAASPPAAAATPAAGTKASPQGQDPSTLGVATVPPTTAVEKKAAKLSSEALGPDFQAGHFNVSESKLREAIRICVPEVCSVGFQARLHRDIGFVYAGGLMRVDDGKDEFTAALSLDPTVALTPAMQFPDVTKAFMEVRTYLAGGAEPQPPIELASEPPAPPPLPPPPPPTSSDDSGSEGRLENWVSLSIQQDLVFHTKTADACGLGSRYECFDATGLRKPLSPGDYLPGGNQISGSGALPGTLRILVGYERVVHPNVTVGVKVGSVVTGKPRRMDTDKAFLFFHGEGRVSLWIGKDVFSKPGVRPYLFVSGGIAEAAGKILVDFSVSGDPNTYKLDAWKRSGHSFLGPGLGVQAAFSKNNGPVAEFRYMQFMSPNVPVIAFQLGYAFGF
jgi:hypothetical protein